MSRLSRLRCRSHGSDGLWAYNEIVRLRAEVTRLQGLVDAGRAAANGRRGAGDGAAAPNPAALSEPTEK